MSDAAETSPRTAASEQSLADSMCEEREATLRAAAGSPGVSFDVAHSHGRRSGKHSRRRQMPEPEPEAAPAPRLSFAERFGGTKPGAADAVRGEPSELTPGMDDVVSKHFSPRSAHSRGTSGPDGGSSDAVGSSTSAASGPGKSGTGPYRTSMSHGTGPYQMSQGPATRRPRRPQVERFDVRSWADEQKRASEAPTLRHFYSEIRTIH